MIVLHGETAGTIPVAIAQPRFDEAVERRVEDLLARTARALGG